MGQGGFLSNMANWSAIESDNAKSLNSPCSTYIYDNKVYVADSSNNRILIYNGVPGEEGWDDIADYVLGQGNVFDTNAANKGGRSANSLQWPTFVYSDGSRVYVTDQNNERVLIYNGIPGEVGWDSTADYLIGQPDMISGIRNNGGVSANSLSNPSSVYTDGSKVYVSDLFNSRVLIYNGIPGEDGWDSTADYVLGQGDVFTTNTANKGGISANSLYYPESIYSDGIRVYVADGFNNRLLIYNGIPGEAGWDSTADYVLGQGDVFTTNTANKGGISANCLSRPGSVYTDGRKVYVSDNVNNRVLIYDGLPGEEGWDSTADYVLGQGDVFTTNTANKGGISANSLYYPESIYSDGNRLYIADRFNHRSLIYDEIPGEAGWDSTADYVLGQGDVFTTNTANKGGISAASLYSPNMVYCDGSRVYVSDYKNNRVLIYNGVPGEDGWNNVADYVIGQPDFVSNTANNGGISANSLYTPFSVYSDGSRVYVADADNRRVLIYNGVPGEAGWDSTADYVLGQGGDFTTSTLNKGGITADSLNWPSSVYSDGSRIYVTDEDNNRVLIYNGVPGEAGWDSTADYVLGQGDVFNTNTANKNGVSANSLYWPRSVYSDGGRIYVADAYNHRVLIYNGVPGEEGWNSTADYVLGQGDVFNTRTANKNGFTASSLNYPSGINTNGSGVYVSDRSNNRVLIYNGVPGEEGWDSTADYVLGQANDFTTRIQNKGGISANSLSSVYSVYSDASRIYVADTDNNRVLIYGLGPQNIISQSPSHTQGTLPITLGSSDATDYLIKTSQTVEEADWTPFSTSHTWTFGEEEADGEKTLWVKMRDYLDYESDWIEVKTVLDRTKPLLTPELEKGDAYTEERDILIDLKGYDNLAGLSEMLICENPDFTGCDWESYSESKAFTISEGDGLKRIYAKVKDRAGNISEVTENEITLDTVNNKPIITKLGLIKGVPDKDNLYYYFNANRVRIYGVSEASSTVQFERVNGTKYTTQADGSGNFLIIIDLPNGETKLTYSSTDLAGNVSGSRTITLNIDPSYGMRTEETQEEITASAEETTTPTDQEKTETEQKETPVVKSLLVVDSSGNILSNKTIVIEGKEYKTDERGYIHTDQGFTSDLIASIEGRNYTIKPSNTYLTFTEAQEENKSFNYLYCLIPILLIIAILGVVVTRRKNN